MRLLLDTLGMPQAPRKASGAVSSVFGKTSFGQATRLPAHPPFGIPWSALRRCAERCSRPLRLLPQPYHVGADRLRFLGLAWSSASVVTGGLATTPAPAGTESSYSSRYSAAVLIPVWHNRAHQESRTRGPTWPRSRMKPDKCRTRGKPVGGHGFERESLFPLRNRMAFKCRVGPPSVPAPGLTPTRTRATVAGFVSGNSSATNPSANRS